MITILLKPNCPLLNRRNYWVAIMLISTHQPAFRKSSLSYPRLATSSIQRVTAARDRWDRCLENKEQLLYPARDLRLSKWSPSHLPAVPSPLLLPPPGQLAEKLTQLSRAGKVGLCSAGLPFKGLFGHNNSPYYSCRLRCQGEELMFLSARQEIRSFPLYVL